MPKTHNKLWAEIINFEALYNAFKSASKGKRFRADVLQFGNNIEENLIDIQNGLIWKEWEPGRWKEFYVCEPKKRLILAPMFRDRVVHHALVQVIEPLFEKKFIYDSYACRKNKGTHAAVNRVQYLIRREKRNSPKMYVLKCDISKYFPSIHRLTLKSIIRRTIKDRDTLWLVDKIIDRAGDHSEGLPIGALTSQLFANIYLNELDHFIKDCLGIKNYARYMDDFVIIHHDKSYLQETRNKIKCFLDEHLRLQFNPKTQIALCFHGVDFCGYRIWPTHILPRKRIIKKVKRKFKSFKKLYTNKEITLTKIRASVMSFLGYTRYCNAYDSTLSILNGLVLSSPKNNKTSKPIRKETIL